MDNPSKYTRHDWVVEILTLSGLVATLLPLLFYQRIGEGNLIPIHYNLAGEVDGWSDRSFLWHLPLIAIAFYLGLTLLERFYKKFCFPIRVTENNSSALYRLGVRLLRHIKLLFILIFAYLNNSSLAIALGKENGMHNYIMTVLIALPFGTLVLYYFKMCMYKE